MHRHWAVSLAVLIFSASARAEETDEATALAKKLTTAGAATFDTKDARAMAAYYTEDAQLFYVSKDKDTKQIKTEVKSGRAEIEEGYKSLFKDGGMTTSRNTVEYARLIDPDILVIAGSFEPNTADALKVPFFQVRVRSGERWLIASLRIFIVPGKP